MEIRHLVAICLVVLALGIQLGQWGQVRKESTYDGWNFLGTVISGVVTLWLAGVI